VKTQVVAAAEAAILSAQNKVEAELQQLAEHQAALAQVEADFVRQQKLYEEQIVSQLKFQEAERKLKEAGAKVAKSEAYVKAAQNDLAGKKNDRQAKEQKAQVDIDYATAALRKTKADVAKAESDVAKAQAELNKAQKNVLESETKLARQRNQTVSAPFDGFVTRITPNQGSQMLKQGDPICVIVPDTADRAVQIWLDGNDAPLVEPGRHVRLQFEGWPAVQFAGWPSVAVGTFGGEVTSVDATDDGKGKFRIIVLPDEHHVTWPSDRFLRQGVRANGWVLLDRVPLWYEIWRNMNGFPPVVSTEEPKDGKKPKLPKL
jgi:multidrug resistance efflux pump